LRCISLQKKLLHFIAAVPQQLAVPFSAGKVGSLDGVHGLGIRDFRTEPRECGNPN
jgi:hypothetical protein